jgi:lipopolysaccharide/colanic/teichoic acid biosynthesis glycosyltransferase
MQRIFALLLFLLVSPILLLIMLIVVLFEWKTPVFVQDRIGRMQQTFTIYKLRTMKNGKITLLGRIFRKTGIDELPQLINILKGDMNFVGPRPLTKEDIVRLKWDGESQLRRWSVKPGITGMAQLVNVCDANVSWNADMEYISNRSVKLDLKIIWKSMLVPILGKSNVKQHIHK